jgi:hypothetical protein
LDSKLGRQRADDRGRILGPPAFVRVRHLRELRGEGMQRHEAEGKT